MERCRVTGYLQTSQDAAFVPQQFNLSAVPAAKVENMLRGVREFFDAGYPHYEFYNQIYVDKANVAYNMLRLTERLFEHDPKPEYAAFYERALYNHLLPSVNTEKPGFVYFTPTRPAHYRVYSTPQNCFWCCVGTGIENPGRFMRHSS